MSRDSSYTDLFVGVDTKVPLLGGQLRRYVNLDNAASTPALKSVQDAVNQFLPYYSSVHRGTGFKSQISTQAYEDARTTVLHFVGANPLVHTCIFGKNTTEAINKLAHRFPFQPGKDIVITSGMEHHSNDLPWRSVANTIHVGLHQDGRLDLDNLDACINNYRGQIALVAITGASNVTGFMNPIHEIAAKAHEMGAKILVDCAQLAPHRKIDMGAADDPGRLDFVTISAHKLYAPFGTGAIIGLKETFEKGDPDMTGGGTVEIVTLDEVIWSEPPEREEAGSPNTVGAVALAVAVNTLSRIGMDLIAEHEARLTAYTLEGLEKISEIRVFGDPDPARAAHRLGVVPFMLKNATHFKAAAILGYEFGIGVRSGCFCAHPYILHLLGLNREQAQRVRSSIMAGDRSEMPGLVRASFGLYNTFEDVDVLLEALQRISNDEYKGRYTQDQASGEYKPSNWLPDFERFFSIDG